MEELRHILFRFAFLIVVVPIFSYGILVSIDSLNKAWKSGSRVKKWFALTTTLLFLAIAFGALK